MSEYGGGGCCRCCFSFVFTLGLTALFLWLALRTSSPKITLNQFYVPSLNKTLNSTTNTTISFQLKLVNTNKDKGVYYDPINVTFFDAPNTNHSIGNYTLQGFYQGHEKKAIKSGLAQALGVDPTGFFRAVSVNGSVAFRVDMATSVRYKIVFWKSKRKKIMVKADFQVNDQGSKVNSSIRFVRWGYFGNLGVLFVNLLVWAILN